MLKQQFLINFNLMWSAGLFTQNTLNKRLPLLLFDAGTGKVVARKTKLRGRYWFSLARAVHVYLSMVLFSLMLMFCVTGLLLNHTEWLQGLSRDGEKTLDLPEKLMQSLSEQLTVDNETTFNYTILNALKTYLNNEFSLTDATEVVVDEEFGEIILDYSIPAGFATVVISTEESSASLTYRKGSYWQILNDLHKGRHSGTVWSWTIDISAVLMSLFSIAGMVILFQTKKYRKAGAVLAIAGTLTPLALYLMFVPRLTGIE